MSGVAELEAAQRNGTPDPIDAAAQLGVLLDLESVGLRITGARVVGRGSTASADLYLSDGSQVTFETLSQFGNAQRLALEIASCTRATPALKQPQALRAVALLMAIAEHQETFTRDQLARDWGITFLQSAQRIDFNLDDQRERWGAFTSLKDIDPVSRSHQDGGTIARHSVVLAHQDGTRFVRTGWFRAHVRHEDPTASPHEIAQRMLRVGWRRRGETGRIKATAPGRAGSIGWNFHLVPAEWEDDPDEPSGSEDPA